MSITIRDDAAEQVSEADTFEPPKPTTNGRGRRPQRRREKSEGDGSGKTDGRLIDPVPVATAYLASSELDDVPRLRHWHGTWIEWERGAYQPQPPSVVQSKLVEYLDIDYSQLTKMIMANVLMGLQSRARLPHNIEPPAWIGPPLAAWQPNEILVALNGLFHLPSLIRGEPYRLAPTPRFFSTAALDYPLVIDAPRPDTWLTFLGQLWSTDENSVRTLQEWFGLCLTPNTHHQKILAMIGPKRSGKGTICRVLSALIGRANVAGPTLASLATNFGLWPMIGKSVAIISDARLGGRTDSQIVVERLLSISGEDPLTIDRKNLEPMTVTLPTRLMLCSNELPRLGDASGALASRMVLLKLTESFYGRENHALTDKLFTELPGILLWSIEGWRRLSERGHFEQPDSANDMLGELSDLASPAAAFIREVCELGPEFEVSRKELHQAYCEWAKEKGKSHVEDEVGFGRNLRAALPALGDRQHRIDGQPTRFYVGIRVRN